MNSIRFTSFPTVQALTAVMVGLVLLPGLAWSASSPEETQRKEWVARFKQADTDKSGGLSQAELKKTEKLRFALIKKHFKAMDTNHNREVSIAERDAFIAKSSATTSANKR